MNSKERKKLARAIAHRAERNKDISLARSVASALVGNARVAKALSLIDYKACPRPVRETSEGGAMCLPQVAMFAAGSRSENYTNPYHVMKG
ncbi:hypothetical protein [Serratia ficaria]|uniref:hypothetical protein n=1 Tax=Serratia ficaria TaxID=61651 RepID=UPI0021B77FF2|nr:hypothetical protein [Serratia ficaria]